MPLIAHNLTATPLVLAAGTVTLPVSAPVNVTGELRPDLTVDPTNGVVGGLSAANFTSIQAQVAAGDVIFDWTLRPEYLTGTLVIDQPEMQNSSVTQSAINYYVDAAGSDSNPGTQTLPFLTIQKALDSVPKTIRHPVTVNVGAGNFTGATLSGFNFDLSNVSPASNLVVSGTLVDGSATTGVISGVVASSTAGSLTAWGTLVCTGAGWTVDDLRGQLIESISGGVTTQYVISNNTADTITIAGFWAAPTNGSTFTLKKWATNITTGVNAVAVFEKTALSTSYRGFDLVNMSGGVLYPGQGTYSNAQIILTNMAISINGYGVSSASNAPAAVIRCKFEIAASKSGIHRGTVGPGQFYVSRCYFVHTGANGTVSSGPLYMHFSVCEGNGNSGVVGPGVISQDSSYLCILSTDIHLYAYGALFESQPAAIQSSKIRDCTVGVRCGGRCAITSSLISNCVTAIDTAISATAPGAGTIITCYGVIGTGNTTVIKANNGANICVNSTSTITGATEILIDGVTSDFATMRAATPKYVVNATTGSKVWGD